MLMLYFMTILLHVYHVLNEYLYIDSIILDFVCTFTLSGTCVYCRDSAYYTLIVQPIHSIVPLGCWLNCHDIVSKLLMLGNHFLR